MEKINKNLRIIIIIILLISLYGCSQKVKEENLDNYLRLRIIANSNNEEDQENKILIKNIIWEYFNNNYDLNIENINNELKNKLDKDLYENIEIKLTKINYEAKSYQGKFIPAGQYETILIMIGEGKGKNFWTILYPEFFNVTFEDNNEIEYRSYFYDIFSHKSWLKKLKIV